MDRIKYYCRPHFRPTDGNTDHLFIAAGLEKKFNMNFTRYRSLGYDKASARTAATAQTHLLEGGMKLQMINHGVAPWNISTMIHIYGISDALLDRDAQLMKEWNIFLALLASTDKMMHAESFHICLDRVVEKGTTMTALLDVFKVLHRPRLIFLYSKHSVQFAIKAMMVNPTLEAVVFSSPDTNEYPPPPSPFKCMITVSTFVASVEKHGQGLKSLYIDGCNVGRSEDFVHAFVPILDSAEVVSLARNNISSGILRMAHYLSENPRVKDLCLAHNKLTDEDALKLSFALRTNTTLRYLELKGNNFSGAGIQHLLNALKGLGSFNSTSDSNHTCRIDLINLNLLIDNPRDNRTSKLLYAALASIRALGSLPTELAPRLLALLQEGRRLESVMKVIDKKTNINPLDAVFQYVSEWNGNLFNPKYWKGTTQVSKW